MDELLQKESNKKAKKPKPIEIETDLIVFFIIHFIIKRKTSQ